MDMQKPMIKYLTRNCVIAGGSAADTYTFLVETDTDYELVDGIASFENETGGLAYYRMSLEDDQGNTVQQLTNRKDWIAESVTPPKDRYKPMLIKARGRKYIIKIQTPTATSSAFNIDIVFRQTKV